MRRIVIDLKFIVLSLIIIFSVNTTYAQRTPAPTEAKQINVNDFPSEVRAKATRAKQEALAYLLQALAHSKSPSEYATGRDDLAARLVPVINAMANDQRSRMQEKAIDVLSKPGERQKLLGPGLAKLDFKRPVYEQMQRDALLRPGAKTPDVSPKSGNNAKGMLKLRVKKVEMKDETNPEGGSDEIYLGAVCVDADNKATKKTPFHVADFDEWDYKEKTYNPGKIIKSFSANPNLDNQSFYATFLLFEEDGVGMYEVVDIILDFVAGALASYTYGISVIIKEVADFIIYSIAGDDAFPPFTHELTLNGTNSNFSKNYYFWVKAHGGHYVVDFSWDYEKTSSASQPASSEEYLELPKVFKGDDGATYYVSSTVDNNPGGPTVNVVWYGEHPDGKFANVFRGYRTGNIINGVWADLPNGKGNYSGTLKVELVKTIVGNILKPVSQTGGFSCTKWLPANPPANAPGKKAATFSGGIGNMDGLWTCDDGGVYYFNQVDNKLFWYGQQDKMSGKPAFANVGIGSITGETISLYWWDVPKGNAGSHGFMILKKAGDHGLKKATGDNFGGSLWTRTPETVRPPCKTIDLDQLTLKEHARGATVYHNGQALFAAYIPKEAEWIYNVLKINNITRICTIGEGKNRTRFIFSGDDIPSGPSSSWENCISFAYRSVKIKKARPGFLVTDGKQLNIKVDTEAEANTIVKMINKHRPSKYCTIGKNGVLFDYWKK